MKLSALLLLLTSLNASALDMTRYSYPGPGPSILPPSVRPIGQLTWTCHTPPVPSASRCETLAVAAHQAIGCVFVNASCGFATVPARPSDKVTNYFSCRLTSTNCNTADESCPAGATLVRINSRSASRWATGICVQSSRSQSIPDADPHAPGAH